MIGASQRGTLIEIHIADIHFDAFDPKIQYDMLEAQFLNQIDRLVFDILSIDGDLFHHKGMSNSNMAMYATMFVDRCVRRCKEIGATLVLLHGTYTHDSEQLKLFYHYLEDPEIDIRIIETARFELIKNARILCIPEEYGRGYEYYADLLYRSGWYDSVFMHGTIKGAIYGMNEVDLGADKAPVFDLECFKYCCGPVIAGHVHVPGCYDSHMYYCGSPLRWQFGEEQQKGFIILLHNLDTNQYLVNYVPITSYRYDTVNLDSMLKSDPRAIIDYIKDLRSNGIDYIRVEFSSYEMAETIDLVKKYFRNDSTVKFKLPNRNMVEIKRDEEFMSDTKFGFITDNNLTCYDKLSRFINESKGEEYITSEELIEVLKRCGMKL